MSATRLMWMCRLGAGLGFIFSGILWLEAKLGYAIMPWGEDPDPTTEIAALGMLFLSLLLLFAGQFGVLRVRIEQMESQASILWVLLRPRFWRRPRNKHRQPVRFRQPRMPKWRQ